RARGERGAAPAHRQRRRGARPRPAPVARRRRRGHAGAPLDARVLLLWRLRKRDELFVSNAAADFLRSAAEQIAHMEQIRRARLRVAERITDLIGDTPIVRLKAFDKETPG